MPERFAADWLERRWYSSRAPWLLQPLSFVYGALIRLRRAAYRHGWFSSAHPGVPVVVVGNLTVGGTGKTPFTLWLAEALRSRGYHVGIASRGYGGTAKGPQLVTADSDAAAVGDESLMMSRRGVPVCIARRRIEAARLLAQQGCQLVIADDGLQHLALRRDVEIVVVDASRGFGNAALLPAGPLREPYSRLESVDLVVVNGAVVPSTVAGRSSVVRMALQGDVFVSLQTGHTRPAAAFIGEPVHAVAGIGHPERFFQHLRKLGISVIEHPFPDHHRLSADELAFGDHRPVVMTEKDAVKCAFDDARLWFLPVTARLDAVDAQRVLDSVLPLVRE
jgi:tetraacyldisaccharide 4'-kinase